MLLKCLLLICLIPALAMGQATPNRRCSGGRPFPSEVRVAGCTTAICNVKQGDIVTIEIDFSAPNAVTGLRAGVNAIVGSNTVAYPLPGRLQNGCNHLVGKRCPLAQNEAATYNFVLPITSAIPTILVGFELSLLDQLNQPVFCTIIDMQLQRR